MANKCELIKITDIENNEVIQKIKEYTDVILKFGKIVSWSLDKATLKDPQIYIVKTPKNSFDIYWCYSFDGVYREDEIKKMLCGGRYVIWQECLVIFQLSITIKDVLATHFQLYITGSKPENDYAIDRLMSYSYKSANEMLNYNLILECINKINIVYKKVIVCKQIDELKYKTIPNLSEIISNCSIT